MATGWADMRSRNAPLAEVIESYLLAQHHLSEKTLLDYRKNLVGFDKWLMGGRLADLDPGTVNRYVAEKKRRAPYAARLAAATLKAFASWLAENDILSDGGQSVLRAVKTPRVPRQGRPAFSDDELKTIIHTSGDGPNGARDKAVVLVMAGCGLRLNEVRELRLGDMDLQRRILLVRGETSKSARDRTVRLDAMVAAAVDTYVNDWRPPTTEQTLFVTVDGRKFTHGGFANICARLSERLAEQGVKKFMAHRLRHTWATNYHRAGSGTLFDLQAEGGWSDLDMVRRYTKARPMSELQKLPTPLSGLRGVFDERRHAPRRKAS